MQSGLSAFPAGPPNRLLMGWQLTDALAQISATCPGDQCHGVMANARYSVCGRPCRCPHSEWPLPCIKEQRSLEMRGSMTLDGQVLVIAFLALSLNLVCLGRRPRRSPDERETAPEGRVQPSFGRPRYSKADKR